MSFLPADYQAPKSSSESYMKLQEGENKIRILSAPIFGWEDWQDNKPIRFRMNQKPLRSVDSKKPVKHFWAFIVWNYVEEKIQILNLTQATIRNCIEALSKDEDWGAPYHYDIKIIKKGEGMDTEYMVNPLPHKLVSPNIITEFQAMPCYLEALFDNADPFSNLWSETTQGIFTKDLDTKKVEEIKAVTANEVSDADLDSLNKLISECQPGYRDSLMARLNKNFQFNDLKQITKPIYEILKVEVVKKQKEYADFLKKENEFNDVPF